MFEAKVSGLIKIVLTNWTQSVGNQVSRLGKNNCRNPLGVERKGTIIIYHYKIKVLSFLQMFISPYVEIVQAFEFSSFFTLDYTARAHDIN